MSVETSNLAPPAKTGATSETPSFCPGKAGAFLPVFGPLSIQRILRGLLLGWLTVVYRVSRFLKKKTGQIADTTLVPAFDILNAGPDHRFTTGQFNVSNCGYGMGVDRFVKYAAENGNRITATEAKPVVDGFRKGNPLITRFWRRLDNLIIAAARDPEHRLQIEMPTGDTLEYFGIRPKRGGGYEGYTTKGEFSKGEGKFQANLWGGTLTENVTQRMARDVMAEAGVRLEKAGFPVAFTSHDELILVVPEGSDEQNKETKKAAEQIMQQPPEWAKDLPLACEGEFSPCYTKA